MSEWILVETCGGGEPKVIAVGRKPRPMKDVEDVIRGSRRTALRSAIDLATATKEPVDKTYAPEGFRVVAEPFVSPLDRVNAVRVCAVGLDEELPERLPTGAWVWDLNRATCLVSPERYDVYKKPPELHLTEISRLESLYGVTSSAHRQAEALAVVEQRLLPQIAAAERRARPRFRSPLVGELAADPSLWETFSVADRREVVQSLVSVTVLPTGARGRAAFRPEDVQVLPA